MIRYGEKIYSLRKEKNMTQKELGNLLNVSFQAVSKWEKDLSIPDLPTLQKLVQFFGISLEDFLNSCQQKSNHTDLETASETSFHCSSCEKDCPVSNIYQFKPLIICKDCNDKYKKELEEINKIE